MPIIEDSAVAERLRSIRADIEAEGDNVSPRGRAYALGQLHSLLTLDLITNEQSEALESLMNPATCSSVPHEAQSRK